MEQDIQMYLSELAEIYWRKFESTDNKKNQEKYHQIYDTKNKLDKYCRAQEREKETIDLNLELIKMKLQIIKMSLWNT